MSDEIQSPDFVLWVRKSINLLGTLANQMDDSSAVRLMASNGIPESEANEIILFLPICFCRKLLPQVKWHQEYMELKNNSEIQKRFSDNSRYLIIEEETNLYWNSSPNKQIILNVAGRSPEFNAINDLLLKGGQIDQIRMTKITIVR